MLVLTGIEREYRVLFSGFDQARVLSGLWDPSAYAGAPLVVKQDVPASEWRGEVVRQAGRRVTVRTLDGTEVVGESALGWPQSEPEDDDLLLPPVKPGRVAADPVVEQINQRAYEDAQGALRGL